LDDLNLFSAEIKNRIQLMKDILKTSNPSEISKNSLIQEFKSDLQSAQSKIQNLLQFNSSSPEQLTESTMKTLLDLNEEIHQSLQLYLSTSIKLTNPSRITKQSSIEEIHGIPSLDDVHEALPEVEQITHSPSQNRNNESVIPKISSQNSEPVKLKSPSPVSNRNIRRSFLPPQKSDLLDLSSSGFVSPPPSNLPSTSFFNDAPIDVFSMKNPSKNLLNDTKHMSLDKVQNPKEKEGRSSWNPFDNNPFM